MNNRGEQPKQPSQTGARWLIEHADEALRDVCEFSGDPYKLTLALRKQFTAEQARELSRLQEMRTRARAKFAKSDRMFFTAIGYEQSSSQALAAYKATRYRGRSVVDLCCGIGGDAIWLAEQAARICLVDLSDVAVQFVEANVLAHGFTPATKLADVRKIEFTEFDAWHLDPDRRVDGKRKSSPNVCEPPLNEFLALQGLPKAGAIKLSPAAEVNHLLDLGAELEWIGCQQECRQLVAWFGDLARQPGRRTATWIEGKQNVSGNRFEQVIETTAQPPPITTNFKTAVSSGSCYLYEPRPSVLAARLTDSLATQFSLRRLFDTDYLTGEAKLESLLLRRFRILDTLAFHQKSLINRLAELELRVSEVKTRGVDLEPESILKKLATATSQFDQPAAVILHPSGASIRCLIAVRDQ